VADSDLIFRQSPLAQPADLLFGETETLPDISATLAATLPPLTVAITAGPVVDVTLAATLPGLQVLAEARYASGTERPLVARTVTGFDAGVATMADTSPAWQEGAAREAGAAPPWRAAIPTPASAAPGWVGTRRTHGSTRSAFQRARPVGTTTATGYQELLRGQRPTAHSAWQVGSGRATSARTDWQERFRDRRPQARTAWDEAQRLLRAVMDRSGVAAPLAKRWGARYQEAIVPPPGTSRPPVIPPGTPCYTPPPGSAVPLLFAAAPGDGQLVFICEGAAPPDATVVVPVRRVYIVINNTSLLKVVGSTLTALPTYTMSLALDVDSWTWGLSATLPGEALVDLQPVDGQPVELQASVNGVPYRFLAEKVARERSFGKAGIRLTGRGKSALLAAPYAPILSFANTEARTAAQLMADALTFNGVPIGWDVDWQIDDWLVPAGAWAHQGSYIEALGAIAGAAGAYLQPHPTDQVMRVLHRYPSAPWEWDGVTPDYELPSAVMQTEGIEWLDKPGYNRVFVAGTSAGITGQVTRSGTAGDSLAPMVTDPLITATAAARQRGRAVLGDTGRQAIVSLRLPVLPETGIIVPGKFVQYVDGGTTRRGLVRSTSADSNGNTDLWQSLAVETHVEAA
jgi:hypothetical protein